MKRIAKTSSAVLTLRLEQLETRVLLTTIGLSQPSADNLAFESAASRPGANRSSAFVDSGVRSNHGDNRAIVDRVHSHVDSRFDGLQSNEGSRTSNRLLSQLPQPQNGNDRSSRILKNERSPDRDDGRIRQADSLDNSVSVARVLVNTSGATPSALRNLPAAGASLNTTAFAPHRLSEFLVNREVSILSLSLTDPVDPFTNRQAPAIQVLGNEFVDSVQSDSRNSEVSGAIVQATTSARTIGASDSQRQFTNGGIASWQDDEILDDRFNEESDRTSDETRYGGFIDLNNQPELQETLPLVQQGRWGLDSRERSDSDLEESPSLTDPGLTEIEEFDRLDSGLSAEPSETTREDELPSPALPTTTPPDETSSPAANTVTDVLFAEFSDVDFGGLLDFVSEEVVGMVGESTAAFPNDEAPESALQVDAIIGEAPLLELDESPIGESVSVNANVHPTAASLALFLIPRSLGRNREEATDYVAAPHCYRASP